MGAVWSRFMVFNVTFNNISVIGCRSVILLEETGVPRENHRPVVCYGHTLLYCVTSSTPLHERGSNSQLLMVIGSDCTGSCKSYYHAITAQMVPRGVRGGKVSVFITAIKPTRKQITSVKDTFICPINEYCKQVPLSTFCMYTQVFCNLFILKEKRKQIQIKKTYDMLLQFYTDKRHLIYKNKHYAIMQWNFKHQGQFWGSEWLNELDSWIT